MDITHAIAAEIRAENSRQGLDYAALAKLLGRTRQYVSRKLSANITVFNDTELSNFGKALGVPASELMRRAEEAEKQAESETPSC